MSEPWIISLVLAALAVTAADAQVTLSGHVVDDNEAPVANARVWAHTGPQTPMETHTGPAGAFQLSLPESGEYLVSAESVGFFRLTDRPVHVEKSGTEVTLVLNPQREVFQSVQVGESPSPVDPARTDREQRLSGTEVNNVPYPASNSLRNALRLTPGVIQDPSGGVHFHGGAEYQTQYLLDGFDISDPINGRYSTRLAVEGIRSLDLSSSREGPQNGRGSAGTLAISSENGTDQYHFTATNFIPGPDLHGGLRLGDWTPRAVFSGPIVKGRAWFSGNFDGEFDSGYVAGLPKGEDTNTSWAAGNLFHAQVNLTSANILYADLLTNFDHQDHFGLGALDPESTTSGLGTNHWMIAVKDTHSWSNGALAEVGLDWQRTLRTRVPEGTAPYLLTPEGRSGNYFVDSREHGGRKQAFVNFFPPAFHFYGRHQLQTGADAQRLSYHAEFQRSSYEVVGLSGLPLFETTFRGSGDFGKANLAFASYINDHWQPVPRLVIDAGLREDWDELVRRASFGPRISAAFAPFANSNTKLVGGYSVIYDAASLALFSKPLDQQAVTVPFSPEGVPETPLVTTFVPGHALTMPRYDNVSAGVEQALGHRLFAKLEWLRKRGAGGLVYAPETSGPVIIQPEVLGYGFGGTYALTNLRRDAYDEVGITIRHSFGDQYEWLASYVHSRAISNAVLDVSVDQPLQVGNNLGPMPWDAPNRFLSWGYLPPPLKRFREKWAIAYLVDWRTGFPYSFTDDAGRVVGVVDSHRYPSNLDLNLHIERRFTFRGYRFGIRLGANNLTANRNPTAVSNVIGSPTFMQFFGDEGRHFVLRLRLFGHAKS
ncbi:MAG TPA: carboxypeptidase regulatory-like domain-containing protein [Bryobacteraceae bacterium]|nr:carboxypeptidase regulatory-like domain-containing protein [Bryobacteraceae bacterium]